MAIEGSCVLLLLLLVSYLVSCDSDDFVHGFAEARAEQGGDCEGFICIEARSAHFAHSDGYGSDSSGGSGAVVE